eukprot:g24646.t1
MRGVEAPVAGCFSLGLKPRGPVPIRIRDLESGAGAGMVHMVMLSLSSRRKADTELGIGYWMEIKTGCKVVEKPVIVPSGLDHHQGYRILYAYCGKDLEGVESLLEGALPPMLPATAKEPKEFATLEAIAENFGAKDPKARGTMYLSDLMASYASPSWLTVSPQLGMPSLSAWPATATTASGSHTGAALLTGGSAAAKTKNAAKLAAGLKEGVKGDVVDEEGVSALMMAASEGGAEACEVLLKGGNHLEAVKTLLAAKADTTKVDSEGNTALHWAAVAGGLETARLLASLGQKTTKNAKDGEWIQHIRVVTTKA